MTATLEAIRDRVVTLIEGITPTVLSGDKFRHSLDEGDGDFASWAEQNDQSAWRRFQVMHDGSDPGLPNTSDMLIEERSATLVITIAYPHNKRAGIQGKRDRDDAIDADWRKIYRTIGPGAGQSNFSGSNDCTIMGCSKRTDPGEACDFLVVEVPLVYLLDLTA